MFSIISQKRIKSSTFVEKIEKKSFSEAWTINQIKRVRNNVENNSLGKVIEMKSKNFTHVIIINKKIIKI